MCGKYRLHHTNPLLIVLALLVMGICLVIGSVIAYLLGKEQWWTLMFAGVGYMVFGVWLHLKWNYSRDR